MKFRWHFVFALCLFTILWIAIESISLSMIFIPILMAPLPDVDLKFKSHRNAVFHSILIPVIVFIFNPSELTALVCLSFGLHCLLDGISFKKKIGYYRIKWYHNHEMLNGKASMIWLWANFIASVIILTWWILVL